MGVVDKYVEWERGRGLNHAGHAFSSKTLSEIERLLPVGMSCTAETGCGKSTILFSNLSLRHIVFAYDDTSDSENSSVLFYRNNPITKMDAVTEVFGPTQLTLPKFQHETMYDCVLIDGPHGFPFPEMEYYYFYPNIKCGGILIVDDANIPTIGRMVDILAEDDMWDVAGIVEGTVLLRRTSAPATNPLGDEWWTQKYNRRRVSRKRDIYLASGPLKEEVSSLRLDEKIHGG